jgi:hypothetical protein
MESLRFWLEGVRLWVGDRPRTLGALAAAGAGLATLALLGSTVAAPLLSNSAPKRSTRVATVARQATAKSDSGGGAAGHGGARGRGARSNGYRHTHGASGHKHHGHHSGGKGHKGGGGPQGRGPFAPRPGRILHGVSDTTLLSDFTDFAKQVGARPALLEDFYHWDTPLTTGALQRWHSTDTRGVLSLSTAPGGGQELITPRAIAMGHGDHYLLRLNQSIASSSQVVYLRLFPEMNGYWNPYSAFDKHGSSRDAAHSQASFRRAWQRVALIVRGGKLRDINRELQQRGMPRILRARSNRDPAYPAAGVNSRLGRPKVALEWTPLVTGSPAVSGNRPGAYWPGKAFVDWVGTDLYSKYASARSWAALDRFYRKYDRQPFAIGEYSPYDNDRTGSFTRRLFRWAEGHRRVGMMIYYRSVAAQTAYSLDHFPKARHVIRHELNKHRFVH